VSFRNTGPGQRCYLTAASLGASGLGQVEVIFRRPGRFGTDFYDSLILACCPMGGLQLDGVRIALSQQDRSVVHMQFESFSEHRVPLRRPFVFMGSSGDDHFDGSVVARMVGYRLKFANEMHPAAVHVIATFAGV
jgi:hypothetical protein